MYFLLCCRDFTAVKGLLLFHLVCSWKSSVAQMEAGFYQAELESTQTALVSGVSLLCCLHE